MAQTQAQTVHFCTYNNAETKGEWRKSREYSSMEKMLAAMQPYLIKYPRTTVTFQTRNVYIPKP